MNATAPDDLPSPEDHAYFLTIERTFLGLRKKAALLTRGRLAGGAGLAPAGNPGGAHSGRDGEALRAPGRPARAGRSRACAISVRRSRLPGRRCWRSRRAVAPRRPSRCPSRLDSRTWRRACPRRCRCGRDGRRRSPISRPAEARRARSKSALRALDAELLQALRASLSRRRRQGRSPTRSSRRSPGCAAAWRRTSSPLPARGSLEQSLRRHFAAPVLSLFSPEAQGEGAAPGRRICRHTLAPTRPKDSGG